MSKATWQALDDALAAHISDESDGDILTGYLVQTASMPIDGAGMSYAQIFMSGQPYHSTLGLAAMAGDFGMDCDDEDDE